MPAKEITSIPKTSILQSDATFYIEQNGQLLRFPLSELKKALGLG